MAEKRFQSWKAILDCGKSVVQGLFGDKLASKSHETKAPHRRQVTKDVLLIVVAST